MSFQKSDKFKKIPKKSPGKVVENYIDNEKFYSEMVIYHGLWRKYLKEVEVAEKTKKSPPLRPKPSDYIGNAFTSIAKNLSMSPNFCNYSYRDEMVCDGVVNCLNYIGNFDPEKSKNPFAYFTQICFFAFLRRMEMEKKNQLTKYRYARHMDTKGKLSEFLSKMTPKDGDVDKDVFQQIFDLTIEEAAKMEDAIERKNTKVKTKHLQKKKTPSEILPVAPESPVESPQKHSKAKSSRKDHSASKKTKKKGSLSSDSGKEKDLVCYSMEDFFGVLSSKNGPKDESVLYTDVMCQDTLMEYVIRGITGGH